MRAPDYDKRVKKKQSQITNSQISNFNSEISKVRFATNFITAPVGQTRKSSGKCEERRCRNWCVSYSQLMSFKPKVCVSSDRTRVPTSSPRAHELAPPLSTADCFIFTTDASREPLNATRITGYRNPESGYDPQHQIMREEVKYGADRRVLKLCRWPRCLSNSSAANIQCRAIECLTSGPTPGPKRRWVAERADYPRG